MNSLLVSTRSRRASRIACCAARFRCIAEVCFSKSRKESKAARSASRASGRRVASLRGGVPNRGFGPLEFQPCPRYWILFHGGTIVACGGPPPSRAGVTGKLIGRGISGIILPCFHCLRSIPGLRSLGVLLEYCYARLIAAAWRVDAQALFDRRYYLSQNPDIVKVGMNPFYHYIVFGGIEGRRPHPLFDGEYYLARYPDVKRSGHNPLLHFLQIRRPGRTLSASGLRLRLLSRHQPRCSADENQSAGPFCEKRGGRRALAAPGIRLRVLPGQQSRYRHQADSIPWRISWSTGRKRGGCCARR